MGVAVSLGVIIVVVVTCYSHILNVNKKKWLHQGEGKTGEVLKLSSNQVLGSVLGSLSSANGFIKDEVRKRYILATSAVKNLTN